MKKLLKIVLPLVFSAFVFTGCGNLLDKFIPTPDPERPVITLDSEDYFKIHYDEEAILKVIAEVDDKGSLSYQWYSAEKNDFKKASAISGATDANYTVKKSTENDSYYWCEVTNKLNLKDATEVSGDFHVIVTNVETIDYDIGKATTWKADYTYYVTTDCHVNAALTIEPGTIIKFSDDSWLGSRDNGKILANGTEEKPIIFTSEWDKTVGINVYKGTNLPEAGLWEGISSEGASGSSFEYCEIRYAGSEYGGAMELSKKTTVKNCTFPDNLSPAPYTGALNFCDQDAITSTVEDNVFYDNEYPVSCYANFTFNPTNKFTYTDANGTVHKNVYQGIFLKDADITSSQNITYGITEVPYVLQDELNIYGKLIIEDNVVVRVMKGVSIDIEDNDSTKANLTLKNCIITSFQDDAHGGDINGDKLVDVAEEADWEGIYYQSTAFNNALNKDTIKVLFNDDEKIEE